MFIISCLQIKDGFADGKDLVVTVMSAMGEEQICALKDIGPKNWIYAAIALFADKEFYLLCMCERWYFNIVIFKFVESRWSLNKEKLYQQQDGIYI